jgi:hypothetical protein
LGREGAFGFLSGRGTTEKSPWFLSQMPTTSRDREGKPSRMMIFRFSYAIVWFTGRMKEDHKPIPNPFPAKTEGMEFGYWAGKGLLVSFLEEEPRKNRRGSSSRGQQPPGTAKAGHPG